MADPDREPLLRARLAAGSCDPHDYLELANLLKETGRFREVAAIYEQGLRLDVSDLDKARFAWALGSLFGTIMGRTTEAASLAHRALELLAHQPESPEIVLLRGLSQSLLAHAVWYEDSAAGAEAARAGVEWLEQLIAQEGQSEFARMASYEAARVYNALGNHSRAIECCEECLRRDPDEHERLAALMVLADALQCAGRLLDAEEAARRALGYARADERALPSLLLTLGLIHRAAGRPAEAVESFEQALRALRQDEFLRDDPDYLSAIYGNLGQIYYDDMRDFSRAVRAIQELLAQYPEDGTKRHRVLIWLGDCHVALGQRREARRYYEEVVRSPVAADEERQHARDGLALLAR